MTLLRVNAFSRLPIMPTLLISDAEHGTGIIRYALLALRTGLLMLTKSAFLSLISVKVMMKLDIVPFAIKVMILKKDNAFSQPQTI